MEVADVGILVVLSGLLLVTINDIDPEVCLLKVYGPSRDIVLVDDNILLVSSRSDSSPDEPFVLPVHVILALRGKAPLLSSLAVKPIE